MSVIDWGNACQTIAIWRMDRYWISKDFDRDWQAIDILLNEGQREVCLLIDLRQCLLPVSFASDLSQKIQNGISQKITSLIVIAPSIGEIFHYPFASRGLSLHCSFYIVDTVDEAYQFADHYNDFACGAFYS